jgi:uncharacterized protein
MTREKLNIAVIGSGAAGLTAAWLLRQKHAVTLFEKSDRVGGHTNTVVIESGPDAGTPVDTGFIVFNDRNYPTLTRLFARLGCGARFSDMSFGFFSERTGLSYCASNLNGLFAQRTNLLRPSYWRMWAEVFRFWRVARESLAADPLGGKTMGQFLAEHRIGRAAVEQFILPMGAAIWSAPHAGMLEFPAESMLRFWANHGLLSANDHPRWQTVIGGSHSYVKLMRKDLRDAIVTCAQIEGVRRDERGAVVRMNDGREVSFDRVVIAVHADQALRLLADPSADEQRLLGAWTYSGNHTVLHTDTSFMPANRRAWASWNYVEEKAAAADRPVPVTYWMNRLQGLRASRDYLVTLNPSRPIAEGCVLREFTYEHPQFTAAAVASQRELPDLNGRRSTFFCGSYFGHGFHEDAVKSGANVAQAFGVEL